MGRNLLEILDKYLFYELFLSLCCLNWNKYHRQVLIHVMCFKASGNLMNQTQLSPEFWCHVCLTGLIGVIILLHL